MTFKIIRPAAILDANLISSNIPETDYVAYSAATTYGLGDRVRVVAADIHYVYQSVVAGNLNHNPLTDSLSTPAYWSRVGRTNRWTMFDDSITSQSTSALTIDVSLQAASRVDSVAFLNIDAASVQVVQTDITDGEVYNRTFSLVSTEGIIDGWSWCFEPIIRVNDFAVTDMLPYANATVDVIISDGVTAKLGGLVLGLKRDLGAIQYGASIGIQDYSIKVQDDWGNYSITPRAFNKLADWSLWIENGKVDQMQTIFAGYRATPIVYIGSEEFNSTIIYGFYADFKVAIQYPTHSICSLALKGLT